MERYWSYWALLSAVLLCVLDMAGTFSPHHYYWWLQRQQSHRKLHGPNVCAVEILPGSGLAFHTECRNWRLPRTLCGQRAQITYDCCVGFAQIKGYPGCMAAGRLENMILTLRRVGAEWMAKTALASGFHNTIGNDAAVTLFAPTDETAGKTAPLSSKYQNDKKNPDSKVTTPLMHYHVLRGRYRLADLQHNAVLRLPHAAGTLRLTRYQNGMVAVNCARVLAPNHEATDGIIHVIDRVLPPPEVRSVADVILAENQLSQFGGLLKKTGLLHRLQGRHAVTVFAPIDKAFNRLSSAAFSHVVRDKTLLKALLQYHVVADSWCTAGITLSHQAATLEGSTVNLTCGGLDTLKVNSATIIRSDLVAKNGIIHFVDDILFPNRARVVWPLLSAVGLTKLAHYLSEAGLNTTLTGNTPLTLLAPSNAAFNALPVAVAKRFQDDVTFLRQVLLYHVISGRHHVSLLTAGRDVGTLEGRRARVHVYPWCTAVESACLTGRDITGLNGIIHVIDSVILPPSDTVAEFIEKNSQFSVLRESLQVSGLVTVFQRPGAFTFLAPTDRAFQSLPSATRDVLLRDPTHIAKILRYHVVGDVHISCSIRKNLVYPLVTLLGHEIMVRRQGDQLMVGDATFIEKDIMATNGVVHIIDKVLIPDINIH